MRLCRHHPLSASGYISSLQSKYVKYLQFNKEFPEFDNIDNIIYADHKQLLDGASLDTLEEKYSARDHVLSIPSLRTRTIREEISLAKKFDRYNLTMAQTERWVADMVRLGLASSEAHVKCTAFIYYKDVKKCRRLLDEVYEMIWRIGQPECQIIFGMISQKYNFLSGISWNDVGGKRILPT